MEKKIYGYTNYETAIHWLNNSLVMCNNIPDIDVNIWDNLPEEFFDEYEPIEVFQWFITDCSERDATYLKNTFDIDLVYSEVFDCYILPVTHYGTSWDYVDCPVYDEDCGAIKK